MRQLAVKHPERKPEEYERGQQAQAMPGEGSHAEVQPGLSSNSTSTIIEHSPTAIIGTTSGTQRIIRRSAIALESASIAEPLASCSTSIDFAVVDRDSFVSDITCSHDGR